MMWLIVSVVSAAAAVTIAVILYEVDRLRKKVSRLESDYLVLREKNRIAREGLVSIHAASYGRIQRMVNDLLARI